MRSSGNAPGLLTGKLFDEQGEGLTPTHTRKGQRRYRYYVSRSLLKGAGTDGWRLAAAEIESAVTAAARKMLDDRKLLIEAAEQHNLDAFGISSLLRIAHERSRQLQSTTAPHDQLAAMLERVELRTRSVRLTLRLLPPAATNHGASLSITHELPLQVRRRGVEKRLLLSDEVASRGKLDRALLKAVARAQCWLEDLLSGRVTSMTAIAAREGVTKRYVSRIVRLALLAPTIVDTIANGTQPLELTAQSLLTRRAELPTLSDRSETRVALELARLATLSVKELKARWRALYSAEPPRYISRELLTRAVAYRVQERAFGGLKPATLRLLERVGADASANHPIHSSARMAIDGTVLVRDWRGVSHRVEVLNDGVVYQGQRYQSLSEVARLITGSRWSGPRFFGLKEKRTKAEHHG